MNPRARAPRARVLLAAVSAISLMSLGHVASAQDQSSGGAQAAGNGDIETVVVTARKRAERLIDVPVSANALSDTTLARYATTDLTAVGTQIPQVSIDHAASGNGAIITIRGIGSASVDAAIEQEVTVNIDDIPISRGRVVEQALFDNSSVEVLKGPQALYFGKNSPAGVIIINSVDPGDTFGGYARVGFEAENTEYYGEAGVSIPLTDDLSVRLAVRGSNMTGGYTKDVAGPITNPSQLPAFLAASGVGMPGTPYSNYPGDKDFVGRATVKWEPTSDFDLTFKFFAGEHRDRGDSMDGVILSCGPGQTRPMSLDFGSFFLGGAAYLTDPYGTCNGKDSRTNSYGVLPPSVAAGYPNSHGGIPFTDIPFFLTSLTMNYKITPQIVLTSTTGFYEYDETQFSNYDETDFSAASGQNDDHFKSWTQELRVETSFDGALNFSGGFFYEHDGRSFAQNGSIGYLGPDPVTGQTNLFGSNDYYTGDTYSFFGEVNYKIADNLEFAGGARYTIEEKTGNEGTTYLHALFAALGQASPVGRRIIGAFTDHNVSPQATLTWHPTTNEMVYVAYKEGFKSGGFSTPALIPPFATPENQAFAQETAKGYEGGLKFTELNNTLTGDITAYHYVYYGLQLTAFDAVHTSYYTQNAGSASTDGVEVNLNYLVDEGLSVHGSAGYNRARYTSFPEAQCWADEPPPGVVLPGGITGDCIGATPTGNPLAPYSGGTQNLAGQPVSRAPDWSALVGFNYETPVWQGAWRLGFSADGRYSSGYFLSTSNSPFAYQSPFATLDASVRLSDDNWEFAVIGRNLSDTSYAVLAGDKPLGPIGQVLGSLGQARQVFIQGTYRF
ncbi:MAG TPA: TonB-dependent receptor [Rhizomicrobium sp.]|nr:TonB-dependent receptor [Rhizomicrobium sp.]